MEIPCFSQQTGLGPVRKSSVKWVYGMGLDEAALGLNVQIRLWQRMLYRLLSFSFLRFVSANLAEAFKKNEYDLD